MQSHKGIKDCAVSFSGTPLNLVTINGRTPPRKYLDGAAHMFLKDETFGGEVYIGYEIYAGYIRWLKKHGKYEMDYGWVIIDGIVVRNVDKADLLRKGVQYDAGPDGLDLETLPEPIWILLAYFLPVTYLLLRLRCTVYTGWISGVRDVVLLKFLSAVVLSIVLLAAAAIINPTTTTYVLFGAWGIVILSRLSRLVRK